jgi:4-carboxymuconolactone decarboxylase
MGTKEYDRGLQVRKEVVGEEYVAKALESADDFTKELQDFITESCWGLVWTRPGLERKTRSLITLGILAATNKYTEIKAHTRGALRNGCTPDEIKEVFLHCFVYSGVPSALEAFRAAQPVIAEFLEQDGSSAFCSARS